MRGTGRLFGLLFPDGGFQGDNGKKLMIMSKVAVVYWTGSGNTQAMADQVRAGAEGAGAAVDEIFADQFTAADVAKYDAFAFGCPAMGDEVLEEGTFQPMWDEVKSSLSGKSVGLFGSYGWGSGQWMEDWKSDAQSAGAQVVGTVIANNAPDDTGCEECRSLGARLA